MCRFVLYHGSPLPLASLITEPTHSIIKQSVHADEADEPLNGDGFGVAWYAPELSDRPAAFRSVTPAWSNLNLLDLARVTKSGCVLAHVRAATAGQSVIEPNCHPFTFGRFSFMHNGDIARFRQIRRRILDDLSDQAFAAIRGSTDSEHLFGVFLDEVEGADLDHAPDRGEALARALERAVHRVVALSQEMKTIVPPAPGVEDDDSWINVAVSDGIVSAAIRTTTSRLEPSSLYVHFGRRYVCEDGVCRMIEHEAQLGAVIISSERLSNDEGWQRIPRDSTVIVRENRTAEVRPIRQ